MLKNIKLYIIMIGLTLLSSCNVNNNDCVNLLSPEEIENFDKAHRTQSYYQLSKTDQWTAKKELLGSDDQSLNFTIERGSSGKESDRVRAQLNLYKLPENTNFLHFTTKFTLAPSISKVLNSDTEFRWLTIFEIWGQQGWSNRDFPFKLTLRLIKSRSNHFLTPRISATFKDHSDDNNWKELWSEDIDIKIFEGERYNLEIVTMSLDNDLMTIVINNDDESAFKTINKLLKHPENPDKSTFWGINPIKLYVGNNVLSKFEKANSNLAIRFTEPKVCISSF